MYATQQWHWLFYVQHIPFRYLHKMWAAFLRTLQTSSMLTLALNHRQHLLYKQRNSHIKWWCNTGHCLSNSEHCSLPQNPLLNTLVTKQFQHPTQLEFNKLENAWHPKKLLSAFSFKTLQIIGLQLNPALELC